MTVNSGTITSGPYNGNDVTTDFSYTFGVTDKSEVLVYETPVSGVQVLLTVDTDYTVNGVGAGPGTITRVAGALPTGYSWFIRANYVETQNTAFDSQGGFFPYIHELAFDKLTYLIKQLRDSIGRTIAVSDSEPNTSVLTIPSVALRADKLLGFDTDGDLVAVSSDVVVINTDIATNTADIATNTADIATNTADIATKADLTGAAFTGAISTITSNTALSDAAATLTAAQLIGGEFTITPTVARIQTTDTAANIIAAMAGSVNNSSFDITVINLAAFDATIAAGTGVTLVGNMVVNDGNATFRIRRLTSSTVSVTRLDTGSGAAPVLTESYESAEQTITSAALLTLGHGLSSEPILFSPYLICKVAEQGYSVGHKLLINYATNQAGTTSGLGVSILPDATDIYVRYWDNAFVFASANRSTGGPINLINSNWRLVMRAFA